MSVSFDDVQLMVSSMFRREFLEYLKVLTDETKSQYDTIVSKLSKVYTILNDVDDEEALMISTLALIRYAVSVKNKYFPSNNNNINYIQ